MSAKRTGQHAYLDQPQIWKFLPVPAEVLIEKKYELLQI